MSFEACATSKIWKPALHDCNKAKAIAALARAIEFGFNDLERIEQNSDLAPLHNDADYKKLLGQLKNKQTPGQE